jgi:hypothetical protein
MVIAEDKTSEFSIKKLDFIIKIKLNAINNGIVKGIIFAKLMLLFFIVYR